MEAADGINDARVIVECIDPYNIFDDVVPLIQQRLPIGNLHWKTPTRPLRSIEELDVSLTREDAENGTRSSSTRRHQIPGLRPSPFVKVLLVRCDDKETYKTVARKQAKDWVKSLEISTSGKTIVKGQERHDAYEYIVLHVVFPDTPAASQPKTSKHISVEASESTDSLNSRSKWTGKSSSTIFDKLRADFHSTSKAPFERVAQVRLSAPGKLNTGVTVAEAEEQWQDLMEKLKIAILQSFDARVAQYEEDIREREAQRSLPGWNFCTYFILKEGLARAFAKVGLLDDALAVYAALNDELDSVVQSQDSSDDSTTASALLPFSSDLKDVIRRALSKEQDIGSSSSALSYVQDLRSWIEADVNVLPWKLERRDYQNMILTNQVSPLDFRIYIFIRETQILLRKANLVDAASKTKVSRKRTGMKWDADVLCEICERSIRFLNVASRNLRYDLFNAWSGYDSVSEEDIQEQQGIIDNVVASWKWSAMLQTLSDCQIVPEFANLPASSYMNRSEVNGVTKPSTNGDHKHSESTATNSTETSVNTIHHSDDITAQLFPSLRIAKGSRDDLTFWAAELIQVMRSVLLQLCQQEPWTRLFEQSRLMERTSLAEVQSEAVFSHQAGVSSPSLGASLTSQDASLARYEALTHYAYRCFQASKQARSSKQLALSLAYLAVNRGDYPVATSRLDEFQHVLCQCPATKLDLDFLWFYSQCLQQAQRYDDAATALASMLQAPGKLRNYVHSYQEVWNALSSMTCHTQVVEVPFDCLFRGQDVDLSINHAPVEDGFCINVRLEPSQPIQMHSAGRAAILLRGTKSGSAPDLTATFQGQIENKEGHIDLVLHSTTNAQGWYQVQELMIELDNVRVITKFQNATSAQDDNEYPLRLQEQLPELFIYPRYDSPLLEAYQSPDVDLSNTRSMTFNLHTYNGRVGQFQLRIKPATADLRIDIQSAAMTDSKGALGVEKFDNVHVISFSDPGTNKLVVFQIPYTLDNPTISEVSMHTELKYILEGIAYEAHQDISVSTVLPISVSVQDAAQPERVFSQFNIASATLAPLSIIDCQLTDHDQLDVMTPETWTSPVEAYSRSSVTWPVRIKNSTAHTVSQLGQLSLHIAYQCLDEIITRSILHKFHASITTSDYVMVSRPLKTHLKDRLRDMLDEQAMERFTLVGEVELWDYESSGWAECISSFSRSTRLNLEKWLREWHSKHELIKLNYDSSPIRSLHLRVDVPRSPLLINTRIQLTSDFAVMGMPVCAMLRVEISNKNNADADIFIEVGGQAEGWVVGGQRRFSLSSTIGSVENTLILVAQTTGHMLLPSVDVRCSSRDRVHDKVVFEVNNLSASTTVLVRFGTTSTTIGLNEADMTQDHWLIDSQRNL